MARHPPFYNTGATTVPLILVILILTSHHAQRKDQV
jgi:hypothetical protein